MKKWFGSFIFDFVRKYLVYLDKESYNRLLNLVYFARFYKDNPELLKSIKDNMPFEYLSKLKQLPEPSGKSLTFYNKGGNIRQI